MTYIHNASITYIHTLDLVYKYTYVDITTRDEAFIGKQICL